MNLHELLDELRVGVLGDVLGRVGLSNPAVLSLGDLIDETRAHLLRDVTGRASMTGTTATLGSLLTELRDNVLRDVSDAIDPNPEDTLFSDSALKMYLNEAYQRVVSNIMPYGAIGPVTVTPMVADTDEPQFVHPAYRNMLVDWAAYRAIRNMDTDLEPGSGAEGSVQAKADGHLQQFNAALAQLSLTWNDEQIARYINEAYQRVITSVLPFGSNTTDKVAVAPMVLPSDTPKHMNPAYHMALADWAAYRCTADDPRFGQTNKEVAADHRTNFERALATMMLEKNDEHLKRYINEGYRRVMARLMPAREDTRHDFSAYVPAIPLTATIEYPQGTKAVRAVYIMDGDKQVELKHTQDVPAGEGRPTHYSTAANSGAITLGPVPDEVYMLSLSLVGSGTDVLSSSNDEPSFDEAFHLMLVDWAAYRVIRTSVANRFDLTAEQKNMLIAVSTGYRNAYEEALRELVYNEKVKVGWPAGFKSNFYNGGC